MLPTSGTFNFQSIQIELIIREAFERIGISGEFVEPVKLESAKRSIDLIFLEWMNKSVNLWTIEKTYLSLSQQKNPYEVEPNVSNIIQANLRTSTRQITSTGVAESSSGIAANAFDGNPFNYCTQDAPNGYISYIYGEGDYKQINFIGITSATDQEYTLTVDAGSDQPGVIGFSYEIPKQRYPAGDTVWIDIPRAINAKIYRIRETGGATLNIEEIYLNNNVQDFPITNVSRSEYYTYPNKYLASRPSVYYFDRQISPFLYLWPVPTVDYNCLQYSYKKMIEDTGSLYTNTVQIPSRFYPALIWGVSWQLALKFNPQIAQMLKSEYEQSFEIATREDSESTPVSITCDLNSYYE